ncbi:MAG: hypothetical protein IKE17_10675, partial [Clostridia bacterium]|nr:hypothetical protein [Clostridia bacterium]
ACRTRNVHRLGFAFLLSVHGWKLCPFARNGLLGLTKAGVHSLGYSLKGVEVTESDWNGYKNVLMCTIEGDDGMTRSTSNQAFSRRAFDNRSSLVYILLNSNSMPFYGFSCGKSLTQRTMNTVHPLTAAPPTYQTSSVGRFRQNPDR